MKMDAMRLDVLYNEIQRNFLGWLESRNRDDAKRLEASIRHYLHFAPHSEKFDCDITPKIIKKSAISKQDFSGRRAALAFEAIAEYASNLICQPWRPEFHEIKLYCGYYKHNVSEILKDPEQLFEAMGYVRIGNSLKLPGIFDPDHVTAVCKDALMAQHECIIMQEIWDAMSACRISWGQIYAYREEFMGTPETAIRHLTQLEKERRYEERHSHPSRSATFYDSHIGQPPLTYAQHTSCHQRYAQIVSPSQVYHQYQHVLKPHDIYPTNGYLPHPQTCYNGYSYNTQHSCCSIPVTVPTGKLIELDSSPVHQSHLHTYSPQVLPEPVRELPSNRAKNDGAGSWESWDTVYKNLGYQKTSAEHQLSENLRGMTLARAGSPQHRTDPERRVASIEFDVWGKDRYKEGSEGERQQIRNDLSLSRKQDNEVPRLSKVLNETTDEVDSAGRESPLKGTPPDKIERISVSPVKSVKESSPVVTFDVSQSFLKDVSPVVCLPPENKWECATCTYFNEERLNACEMCAKSRIRDEIKPAPRGGKECPKCTLVNEQGKNFCAVCNTDLKGSPTYV